MRIIVNDRYHRISTSALLLIGSAVAFAIGVIIPKYFPLRAQERIAEAFYLQRDMLMPGLPSRTEVLARRSDGTTVHVRSIGPVEMFHTFRKIMFLDGRSFTLADDVRGRITWPVSGQAEMDRMRRRILTQQVTAT